MKGEGGLHFTGLEPLSTQHAVLQGSPVHGPDPGHTSGRQTREMSFVHAGEVGCTCKTIPSYYHHHFYWGRSMGPERLGASAPGDIELQLVVTQDIVAQREELSGDVIQQFLTHQAMYIFEFV